MASTRAGALSSFSLLQSSSSFYTSPTFARLASTHLPSLRRLGFAYPALSGSVLDYSSTQPIDDSQNTTHDTHFRAAVPTVEHLSNTGAKISLYSHLVRKNIENMTYQLIDAQSKSRWTPSSRVPGFVIGSSRSLCSRSSNLINESQGPAALDYRSVLQEEEFHKLADSTIHDLLEKLEEYGDSIDIDGFDIDYGNEVLTLKLGSLGTYVVNKQTPNRQIWLSSPVSGPSRYDWDQNSQAWIYRRNQANLFKVLESEIENLCGKPLNLS